MDIFYTDKQKSIKINIEESDEFKAMEKQCQKDIEELLKKDYTLEVNENLYFTDLSS